jgi:methyl-accepting chemotaxis protein
MTPKQETSLERAFGRMEGQLESVITSLAEVQKNLQEANEHRHEVRTRLENVERQHASLSEVAESFGALQQSIRDGKMQVRGIVMGVGLAAGTAGAALPTIVQKIWTAISGA